MVNSSLGESCRLLACQIAVPRVRSSAEKLDHIERLVTKVSSHLERASADLVVLPELSTIEYSREAFEALGELAEGLDGPGVEKIRALAMRYQTAILFGMPRQENGNYFISQIAIAADGSLLACYDKLHICQYGASMEKEFFVPGQSTRVFTVAGFRFTPIICYDIRFPELCRQLTLSDQVDCILHCGAYFRDESFASWHSFAVTRALENQLYLLSLNRAGENYGDSMFCLPWMDENQAAIQFSTFDEDFRFLDIDRSKIKAAREQYPFLEDRLNDYL